MAGGFRKAEKNRLLNKSMTVQEVKELKYTGGIRYANYIYT